MPDNKSAKQTPHSPHEGRLNILYITRIAPKSLNETRRRRNEKGERKQKGMESGIRIRNSECAA